MCSRDCFSTHTHTHAYIHSRLHSLPFHPYTHHTHKGDSILLPAYTYIHTYIQHTYSIHIHTYTVAFFHRISYRYWYKYIKVECLTLTTMNSNVKSGRWFLILTSISLFLIVLIGLRRYCSKWGIYHGMAYSSFTIFDIHSNSWLLHTFSLSMPITNT